MLSHPSAKKPRKDGAREFVLGLGFPDFCFSFADCWF